MHTEVHNAVTAGQKSILAQILVRTVDEFK